MWLCQNTTMHWLELSSLALEEIKSLCHCPKTLILVRVQFYFCQDMVCECWSKSQTLYQMQPVLEIIISGRNHLWNCSSCGCALQHHNTLVYCLEWILGLDRYGSVHKGIFGDTTLTSTGKNLMTAVHINKMQLNKVIRMCRHEYPSNKISKRTSSKDLLFQTQRHSPKVWTWEVTTRQSLLKLCINVEIFLIINIWAHSLDWSAALCGVYMSD